ISLGKYPLEPLSAPDGGAGELPVEMNAFELVTFAMFPVVLLVGWLWIRHRQYKARLERERKLRCKEIILDNRLPLARRHVNFDLLVDLVRLAIRPVQLEKVIELLTTGPVEYNLELDEKGAGLDADLNFEGKPEQPQKAAKKQEEQPGPVESIEEQEVEVVEDMSPEKEKAWLRMAHNRFRHALADKEITERQARFRMLVKMVELGKKAAQDDSGKPVKRKEYELSLWDKYYESEYLELNQE
ncbi:hypothetical protein ACFL4X_01180, partial [Gemmatimonadota bacterium]